VTPDAGELGPEPDWGQLLDDLNAAELLEEEPDLNGCNDWTFEP